MSRSFYSFAIFFTGLYVVVGFLQGIVAIRLGERAIELPSLSGWIVFICLITLVWSLCLLKYYHVRQYVFTFWTMVLYVAMYLFQFILISQLLASRLMTSSYIGVTFAVFIIAIVYAISLIFSKAGKRPWLRTAGIVLLPIGIIVLSIAIWGFNSRGAWIYGARQKFEQYVLLFNSLVPILFIMNFLDERVKLEKDGPNQESWNSILTVVAAVALGATLYLGAGIIMGSTQVITNRIPVGEYSKKLAAPFEARTYANQKGDTLRYRLMLPLNYDSTKKYPFVVCLHGSSARGVDNIKQVTGSLPAQLLLKEENRMKYPAILFVPQCPHEAHWGGVPGFPAVDSLVFEAIAALEEELSIDAKRRYVAGNSMGGIGAWHFISIHPEMFAAAIPISGEGTPEFAKKLVNIPVWAFHGALDMNVPVRGSRDIIEAIKNAGGHPLYTEYADKTHDISNSVTNTPGLVDWLFAQHRE